MLSSSHLLVLLSGVQGDTRRYRTFHPYEQLRLAGVECRLAHLTDPDLLAWADRASIAILHRVAYDRFVARWMDNLQAHGGVCICDVDDLIFEPSAFPWIHAPDFADPLRASLYQEDMLRNRFTLERCQAVTASTEYLAEQARRLGKPVWVHRNAFSLEMLALSQAALQADPGTQKGVIIGYASGTPTHDRDFEVAKPALQEILRRYPQAELWIVGPLNPGRDWDGLEQRVRRHKFIPWRQLPNLLSRFNINLAPLVTDNPFAQSKSEIKYVEAALVRVPTVASPSDAYRFAIRPGENGYLAANPVEWIEALVRLIEQPELRRALGEAAYADVMRRYHPVVRSAELLATLQEISAYFHLPPPKSLAISYEQVANLGSRASGEREGTIDPRVERSPTLRRRALYSLQHRGARTLLIQAWIYFRRLLAPIIPFRKNSP